ncbi:MAG: shikimate kinase [Muribaculaceae bacterium]
MKPVFLIGFMGCGKSTLGRSLAEQTGMQFIDLDHHIESCYNKTVREIFNEVGEEGFRQLEQNMLLEVASMPNTVVACGGGTPCYANNMQLMNSHGITVYLSVSEQRLTERLTRPKARAKRPLIASKTDEEIAQYIHQAMQQRLPYYSQATLVFDSTDIETAQRTEWRAQRLVQVLTQQGLLPQQ